MRCPQCGFEALQGATFCSRCGARIGSPRPEMKREYALTRILPSWWHFSRELLIVVVLILVGIYLLAIQGKSEAGLALCGFAAVVLGLIAMARRYTSWSLTSDRLIERRGF